MDSAPFKTLMLWVRPEKIQTAHFALNTTWSGGFSYIQSCDFLRDDKIFAVQVRMSAPYGYLENQWMAEWNDPVMWSSDDHEPPGPPSEAAFDAELDAARARAIRARTQDGCARCECLKGLCGTHKTEKALQTMAATQEVNRKICEIGVCIHLEHQKRDAQDEPPKSVLAELPTETVARILGDETQNGCAHAPIQGQHYRYCSLCNEVLGDAQQEVTGGKKS